MLNFLKENQSLLDRLIVTEPLMYPIKIDICEDSDIVYAPNAKHLLGLNGTCIPHYCFSLFAWIACQSDARHDEKPFIFYDDEIELIDTTPSDSKNFKVSENGLPIKPVFSLVKIMFDQKSHYQNELKVLTELNSRWLLQINNNYKQDSLAL